MLEIIKIIQALEKKRYKIETEEEERLLGEVSYIEYFQKLENLSKKKFQQLTNNDAPAIPVEFETSLKQSLGNFENFESAIKWAVDQFAGSTITAIDGSQIMPSKEISYPVALVQAGYFTIKFPREFPDVPAETTHDTHPEILISSDSVVSGTLLREGDVALKRQSLEIATAEKVLESLKDYPDPIILLDGTLIYSYMANLNPLTRKTAIKELVQFLQAAERLKIPVIGYIDSSYAKDLAATLMLLQEKKNGEPATDASFLNSILDKLGDYTLPFYCQRKPIEEYGIYQHKVCFSYFRVNSIRVVRLEFPYWIWKEGKYETVLKRILAEVIVSYGYPRVLTRAHQIAVLSNHEREKFHKIVLKYFNDHLDIPVREMIKAKMKRRFI